MDIVVFGAGSLGSLVGGLLARTRRNPRRARGPRRAVRESGLRLEGAINGGPSRVFPCCDDRRAGLEAALAVVTVKSFDTASATETLATGAFDAILSLQNGMGNEAMLAARLEAPCTRRDGDLWRDPGSRASSSARAGATSFWALEPASPRHSRTGSARPSSRPASRRLSPRTCPVVCGKARGQRRDQCRHGAGGRRQRSYLEAPADDLARAVARETAQVARSRDVDLSNRSALAALESVATDTAANTSSMRQDILSERRTEIDAINGCVVDCAAQAGLEVPMNRTLTTLVRTWKAGATFGEPSSVASHRSPRKSASAGVRTSHRPRFRDRPVARR